MSRGFLKTDGGAGRYDPPEKRLGFDLAGDELEFALDAFFAQPHFPQGIAVIAFI